MDKKLLLIHRLWGLSSGLFLWAISSPHNWYIKILISLPLLYFIIFGDSHFKKGA